MAAIAKDLIKPELLKIKKANTNDDQAICYDSTFANITATGVSPVAPAPNIGAITYQWSSSTDNENFTNYNFTIISSF